MNMRKIIAVLAAALMLCAVIPMSAMSVAAAPGDVILQGNFDDGNVVFSGNTTIEDGVLHWDTSTASWAHLTKGINVSANTDYVVSFKMKSSHTYGPNVKFMKHDWATQIAGEKVTPTSEWAEYSVILNSGDNTSILFMIQANVEKTVGQQFYIDDFSIVEYKDPATIGQVKNGDFETGDKSNWAGSATVVADGYESSYAAQMSNPGQWSEALTQTVPVEANTNYEITWMSKRVSGTGAFNLIVCQATSPWGSFTKVAGQNWMNETSGNWVTNTYTVNSGDNTAMFLKFTTEAVNPGVILIDNVVVTKLKDPSDDGFIKNGDFETGKTNPWTVYNTTVDADAAKDGDYGLHVKYSTGGWGGTAYQDFTVEVGKTYVVMMDAKAITKGQNIQIQNPTGTVVKSQWFTSTAWTTLTYEFTATATNTRINICGGGTGVSEEIYVDNVFVFEKKAASNDGYIVNGDFETGTMDGLSPSQQTCVSRDAAKDGNFGLKMLGNGGWGGVGLWTINGLEAGATYKFEMDMNAIEQGFNWTLWQDSTSSGAKYASGYFSTKAWTHIEKEFVANSAVAVLNINGGGNGNAETVYLDNLKITLVKPAHVCNVVEQERVDATCGEDGYIKYACDCGLGEYTEPLSATGDHTYDDNFDAECNVCRATREVTLVNDVTNSVAENDFGAGLAFKFDMVIEGVAIKSNTWNQIDYTNATYNGYKLIGMGVTASNGKSETTIEAKHLFEQDGDNVSVAYRIINIPEANWNDTITMIPYFVVEIDGVETTIYGDEYTATYNDFAN